MSLPHCPAIFQHSSSPLTPTLQYSNLPALQSLIISIFQYSVLQASSLSAFHHSNTPFSQCPPSSQPSWPPNLQASQLSYAPLPFAISLSPLAFSPLPLALSFPTSKPPNLAASQLPCFPASQLPCFPASQPPSPVIPRQHHHTVGRHANLDRPGNLQLSRDIASGTHPAGVGAIDFLAPAALRQIDCD